MASSPSIKGALIGKLVEDAKVFLESNPGRREELEATLGADTVKLLESEVKFASWYPIDVYTELTELLWYGEGGGDVAYLRRRGADAMKRMMDGGLYQQLDFMTRMDPAVGQILLPRDALLNGVRLVGSVTGAIRNFGKDTYEWDPDEPCVILAHCRDAAAFPEPMRFVSEGSYTYLIRMLKPDAEETTSSRVAADHIIFRCDYRGVVALPE